MPTLNTFSINVDSDSIEQSDSKQITGKLVLETSNNYFPDNQWNDFVVTVLGWWLEEGKKAVESDKQLCLSFMDGPFKVLLDKQNAEDVYQLSFVDERKSSEKKIDVAGLITGKEFVEELLDSAHQVISVCKSKKWESTDLKILDICHQNLSREYQKKYSDKKIINDR